MFSKKILALTAAAALVAGLRACQKKTEEQPVPKSGAGAGITWMGYTDGMKKAKDEHKPVMVDFYTSWCKYCKLLDETTYQDAGVVDAVNKGFVAIKVDAEGTGKVVDNGAELTEKDLAAKVESSSKEIMSTVGELDARRRRGDDLDLVDVREVHEWEIGRIEGARLAPLSRFAEALRTFDSARDVVVYCKVGGRSAKAVKALQEAGFRRVWNLEGGIIRWSEEVDPTVPRY